MDNLSVDEDFDRHVLQAIRDHGIGHEEAIYLVALRRGQVYGAGDLVCMQPLTPEQRRAIGLEHDPEQAIEESRARLAIKRSSD